MTNWAALFNLGVYSLVLIMIIVVAGAFFWCKYCKGPRSQYQVEKAGMINATAQSSRTIIEDNFITVKNIKQGTSLEEAWAD